MQEFDSSPPGDAERFWQAFGFETVVDPDSGQLVGVIPEGVVAFVASGEAARASQRRILQSIGIVPEVMAKTSETEEVILYALDRKVPLGTIRERLGARLRVYGPTEPIALPSGKYFEPDWPRAPSGLSSLDRLDEYGEEPEATLPEPSSVLPSVVKDCPLAKFSLAGQGAELERQSKEHTGLFGAAILSGQSTVIYAPPNAGKTLVVLHLLEEGVLSHRVQAQNVYYVNADDSGRGVAEKVVLLDELQANSLVPDMGGFTTQKLLDAVAEMVADDSCSDVIIIIDTLKKFVDLMDKSKSASFGSLVRQFTLKGGTFVALAHTRKNGSPDGQLVYGGTSDVVEDFDAACLLVPLQERTSRDEKIVQFQFVKRRGPNEDEAYSYDDAIDLSYAERLASVQLLAPAEFDKYREADAHRSDSEIIEAIHSCFADGIEQKMAISREAASRSGTSRKAVVGVLEKYTGDAADGCLWTFEIRERGAKVYSAHGLNDEDGP